MPRAGTVAASVLFATTMLGGFLDGPASPQAEPALRVVTAG